MGTEEGEYWRQHDAEVKDQKEETLRHRTQDILDLSVNGYKVERITDYQFRVNDTYDLYPVRNRWHNLKTNQRGSAKDLNQFIFNNLKQ